MSVPGCVQQLWGQRSWWGPGGRSPCCVCCWAGRPSGWRTAQRTSASSWRSSSLRLSGGQSRSHWTGRRSGRGQECRGPTGPAQSSDLERSSMLACRSPSAAWLFHLTESRGGWGGVWGVRFQSSAAHVHNYISSTHTEEEVCLCDLSSLVCTGSFSNQQHNNHDLKQLVQWDVLWVTHRSHRLVLANTPTFTLKPLQHEHPCLGVFFLSALWFHFIVQMKRTQVRYSFKIRIIKM